MASSIKTGEVVVTKRDEVGSGLGSTCWQPQTAGVMLSFGANRRAIADLDDGQIEGWGFLSGDPRPLALWACGMLWPVDASRMTGLEHCAGTWPCRIATEQAHEKAQPWQEHPCSLLQRMHLRTTPGDQSRCGLAAARTSPFCHQADVWLAVWSISTPPCCLGALRSLLHTPCHYCTMYVCALVPSGAQGCPGAPGLPVQPPTPSRPRGRWAWPSPSQFLPSSSLTINRLVSAVVHPTVTRSSHRISTDHDAALAFSAGRCPARRCRRLCCRHGAQVLPHPEVPQVGALLLS